MCDAAAPDWVNCEFCGSWCCKTCANKKFPIPSSLKRLRAADLEEDEVADQAVEGDTSSRNLEMASICKVCECKIYIKAHHEKVDKNIQIREIKISHKQSTMKSLASKR